MEDEAKPSAAPAGVDDDADNPLATRLVRPSHASGGPTAGMVAKTQELAARLRDTPGDTWHERGRRTRGQRRVPGQQHRWSTLTLRSGRGAQNWDWGWRQTQRGRASSRLSPLQSALVVAAAVLLAGDAVGGGSSFTHLALKAASLQSLYLPVMLDLPARLSPQSVMVVAAAVLLAGDAAAGGSSFTHPALKAGLFLPFMFGLLLAASGATGL